MIQFNLLPDVKLQYVKARRTKHLTQVGSILISGVVILVTGLLFSFVQFGQKKHISNLSEDIKKELTSIKSTPDLDKILTIQNQLNTIPTLHGDKPSLSRLLGYIQQLTPVDVTISTLDLSLSNKSVNIIGRAKDLSAATTLSDTLKFAEYSTGSAKNVKIFSNVATTLSRSENGEASYTINASFDPIIFDNKEKISIIVPPTITTRSVTEKPSAVFQSQEAN